MKKLLILIILGVFGAFSPALAQDSPLVPPVNNTNPNVLKPSMIGPHAGESVVEIKGRIDLGGVDYYSAEPRNAEMIAQGVAQGFWSQLEHIATQEERIAIRALSVPNISFTDIRENWVLRPQLKESEGQGYSLLVYINTTAHPKLLQAFRQMPDFYFGMVQIKVHYAQNGPERLINPINPAYGSRVTKQFGPFEAR